jgi:hypothetical protein
MHETPCVLPTIPARRAGAPHPAASALLRAARAAGAGTLRVQLHRLACLALELGLALAERRRPPARRLA